MEVQPGVSVLSPDHFQVLGMEHLSEEDDNDNNDDGMEDLSDD